MVRGYKALIILAIALAIGWAGVCRASEAGYCISCHLDYHPRTLGSFSWQGPVQGEVLSTCPAVRRAKQELFLTECRISSLHDWLDRLSSRGAPARHLKIELHRITGDYRTLLGRSVLSVQQFSSGLAGVRRRLHQNVGQPLLNLQKGRDWGIAWALGMAAGLLAVLGMLASYKRRLAPGGEDPLILVQEGRLPGSTAAMPRAKPEVGP